MLTLNQLNSQIFDVMVGLYSKTPEISIRLLPFMKRYIKYINIDFALK